MALGNTELKPIFGNLVQRTVFCFAAEGSTVLFF